MKTKSQLKRQSDRDRLKSDNRRYSIGEFPTPIGPAKHVVWSTHVVGIVRQPHMVGVKLYTGETIWCHDADPEVQQLIKDRQRNGAR